MICKVNSFSDLSMVASTLPSQRSVLASPQLEEDHKWKQLEDSHHDFCNRFKCNGKRSNGLFVCQVSCINPRTYNAYLRHKRRKAAFKSKLCRNFHGGGMCQLGKGCPFIHNVWAPEDSADKDNFVLQNEICAAFKTSPSYYSYENKCAFLQSSEDLDNWNRPDMLQSATSLDNIFRPATQRPGLCRDFVSNNLTRYSPCTNKSCLSHSSSTSSGIFSCCVESSRQHSLSSDSLRLHRNMEGRYGSLDLSQQYIPLENDQQPVFFEALSGNGNGSGLLAFNNRYAPPSGYGQRNQQFPCSTPKYRRSDRSWQLHEWRPEVGVQMPVFFENSNVYSLPPPSMCWENCRR